MGYSAGVIPPGFFRFALAYRIITKLISLRLQKDNNQRGQTEGLSPRVCSLEVALTGGVQFSGFIPDWTGLAFEMSHRNNFLARAGNPDFVGVPDEL